MRTAVLLVALLVALSGLSQIPQKLSYQFVARNASGDVLNATLIGTRITVLQGSENGEAVYVESHSIFTNNNGVGAARIGDGQQQVGVFTEINWGQGPYFIKTEYDPEGGTAYSIEGTTEVLSVPYALYAENGFFRKIGDIAEGGVIFSLWKDASSVEHGLVVAMEDLSPSSAWGTLYEDTESTDAANGSLNAGSTLAGAFCESYSIDMNGINYSDWYLPAIWELRELSNKALIVNAVLGSDGNVETTGFPSDLNSSYWSSTELNGTFAWFVQFASGIANTNFKDANCRVRAIRRF